MLYVWLLLGLFSNLLYLREFSLYTFLEKRKTNLQFEILAWFIKDLICSSNFRRFSTAFGMKCNLNPHCKKNNFVLQSIVKLNNVTEIRIAAHLVKVVKATHNALNIVKLNI